MNPQQLPWTKIMRTLKFAKLLNAIELDALKEFMMNKKAKKTLKQKFSCNDTHVYCSNKRTMLHSYHSKFNFLIELGKKKQGENFQETSLDEKCVQLSKNLGEAVELYTLSAEILGFLTLHEEVKFKSSFDRLNFIKSSELITVTQIYTVYRIKNYSNYSSFN